MPTLPFAQAAEPSLRRLLGLALTVGAAAVSSTSPANAQPRSLDEAIGAQIAWVESRPEDAAALNDLGNLYALAGLGEQAEAAYREAMRLDPDDAGAPFNLALLVVEGQPREAQKLLRRAISLDPELAWAHYTLGAFLQRGGRRGAAIASFARAFRLDPGLAVPDRNPHVIGNPDATAALLRAKPQDEVDRSTPRDFAEPGRIAALLMARGGEAPATRAPPAAQEPMSASASARRTVPASSREARPAPTREPATPVTRVIPPASTPTGTSRSEPVVRSAPSSPRRVGGAPVPEPSQQAPAPAATTPEPQTSPPSEDLFSADDASAAPRLRSRGNGL